MLALLTGRAGTACPSEVARAVCPKGSDAWRGWMGEVRAVAAGLAGAGVVAVTQRGVTIPPAAVAGVRGPIRLALVRAGEGEV
jgi:hypothetical protein